MNEHLRKVIQWRMIIFPTATTITYIYLGELTKSITLTAILMVVMTTIHFFFEYFWNKHYKLYDKLNKL
jgi:uncharacterized membrane protein